MGASTEASKETKRLLGVGVWNGGAFFFSQEGLVPADLKIQAGAAAPVQQRWVERDTWLPCASRTRRDL